MPSRSRVVLVLAACLFGSASIPASAQEVVIAIFGGSFLDNARICHAAPFEKATGAKINYVLGSSVQNVAKLRATKGRPDIDLAYMDLQIVKQAQAEGLLDEIDTTKLKNFGDLYPSAYDKDKRWIGFMYSGTAIAYNPQVVRTPPTSWQDIWDPQYKGKLALGDISGTSGQHFLIAAARLNGGSLENMDPGFESIKKLKGNVVTYYSQADQIVSLIERGDIVIAPWYIDRVGAAAAKGIPVALSFPKEGAIGILPTVSIPQGAKNKALAERYIDVLLSPEGQKCYAEKQFAGPTNSKVELPPELAKLVPYRDAVEKMYFPDTEIVAKSLPGWSERWAREIVR
jgi:putative spermidine/putrescine transport system substrate-binding protein